MNHLMIDIETLSTAKNAAVVSIGAVCFEPLTGEQGATFYRTVTGHSCQAYGLVVDPETVKWWQKQSPEAAAVLTCPEATGINLVLEELADFIYQNQPDGQHMQVWGNGPSFDCTILTSAFSACGIRLPWRYNNERCCRTMVELGRSLLNIDPKHHQMAGVAHNALADAQHQAKYISEIWQQLATRLARKEAA